MDSEKLGQVLAAFDLLAEDAGGSLDDKPNVSEVKAQGVDVTAEERDEAWAAYQARDSATAELDVANVAGEMVKNNTTNTLEIRGVKIGPGESAEVPGFDSGSAVMRSWLKAKVIEVS